ncbi:transcription factor 7-like 1-A isoform X1 [Oreochromis aureus]|uniref:HMG box domain-containing protein n=1 Tax=Oreochromis aureus TaxID=47969 RepID=A0AAZ1Y1C5_OREAU|nr:transcription factor 7-like 1-A isoform X1 [Oreochromis aureus]XP_039459701.1 transcription factor 7-like 1-A isoform X1 [Oreochromis aureus]
MDIRDENNHISETMQSEEASSTPEDAAVDILGQTSYTLPPPPFPAGTPAPPQPASDPQTGGFISNILPEPAPRVYQQLVPLMGSAPAHLYSQPGTDRQGQLRHPEVNVPGIPENMRQYVRPAGELHGVPFWEFVTPPPPSNPPLRPPFPTGAPAPPQSALDPRIGGFLSHTLLETAPPVSQQLVPLMVTNTATVPAHLYSQPGTDRQGLLRHPEGNVPGIPENMRQYVRPAGELHGVPFWDFVTPPPSNPPLLPPFLTGAPAPPQSALDPRTGGFPKNRKCEAKQDEDRLYIKKPPNAFMIYLKEQRPKVMAELNITGSAAINAVVGKRWRSLSKDQQAKYFDQAETERCRHATEHPDWSTKENYGKKRKRTRNRTSSTASASEPKQEAQQAKRLCVMPAQTQPSSSSSVAKEPLEQPQRQPTVTNLHYQQSACVQLQNTQTAADAPVCQVNPVLPASRIDFSPSASLASSAAPIQLQKDAPFVSDTDEALLSVVEQLDLLLTSEQFQQPSSPLIGPQLNQTSLASPVYSALSTLCASPDTFFENQKEPIGFADIQDDMWSILPVTPQPDTLSCSNTPKYSPNSPASLENSSPSILLDSSVAPTECQPVSPFSETEKNMMSLLNDLKLGPFAQPLQPSSPQADWSSPESDQSFTPQTTATFIHSIEEGLSSLLNLLEVPPFFAEPQQSCSSRTKSLLEQSNSQ